MERLEGWGVGTSMEDEVEDGGDVQLTDWKVTRMSQPLEAIQKRTQTSIQDWTVKRVRLDTDETENCQDHS